MPDRRPLPFDPIAEARRQWGVHGWPDEAPAMAVVTSIMRAQQIFLARADAALRPLGLTFARYEVLMLLTFSRRGMLPLGRIGERLQVNAASVTNAVNRLEDQGLVVRVRNPDDGRGTLARLTPEGREDAARATAVMNAEVFAEVGLGDDEVSTLFAILARLRRGAGDFVEPEEPGVAVTGDAAPAAGADGSGPAGDARVAVAGDARAAAGAGLNGAPVPGRTTRVAPGRPPPG